MSITTLPQNSTIPNSSPHSPCFFFFTAPQLLTMDAFTPEKKKKKLLTMDAFTPEKRKTKLVESIPPEKKKKKLLTMDAFTPEKRKTKLVGSISPEKKKKKYSKGAAPTLLTRPSSSPLKSLTKSGGYRWHRFARHSSPCSYNIVFGLNNLNSEPGDDRADSEWPLTKWYIINIHADDGPGPGPGPGKVYPKPLIPFRIGIPPATGGIAALGSHLYCFGGQPWKLSQAVYKLRLTPLAKEWVPVSPMISPRYGVAASVLGGKLYVRNDFPEEPYPPWGEVFDPANGKWEPVPNPPIHPPIHPNCIIITAALENPDRIIVAYSAPGDKSSAIFYAYSVQDGYWGMLSPGKRKLHPGYTHSQLKRVVSGKKHLYWVETIPYEKDDILFIGYDLDLDIWLEGRLNGLGRFFFQDYGFWEDDGFRPPSFIHLEEQRFCLFQFAMDFDYVRCLIIEISHMPEQKSLGISVVGDQKFAMDMEPETCAALACCLVLPK